jgi:signal transduction histidine kinase
MPSFAPVISATIAIELFASLILAVTYVRRPADRDYGIGALLCTAAAAHALATLVEAPPGRSASHARDAIAWLGLIAALAMAIHFALVYRGVRPSGRALGALYSVALYSVAAVFAGLDLRGMFLPQTSGHRPGWAGAEATHALVAASSVGVAAYVAAALAAAGVLVLVGKAYLAGRREALIVVIGATVLLAALIHDTAIATEAAATGYLCDVGLASFILGIAITPSARYASVARDLDRRSKELRTRTLELRRSYEDLRAAQEELVKKEQLAVVGELAAVIAHEVRNPLAIIANAVAGLRKQAISREDHETLLGILEEETSRLNRLVTDLLRYARPVNVQRSHIALTDLLERALGFAKTKRKTIKIELKRDSTDAALWGDANLLRQVFDNLIDNAVQAMGSGGTLTVHLRPHAQEGIDGVAVDIIDTGEGMDTQVRSRARDPFFTTRPSGTGLGLAIVDRIVDAHGGQFAIESRAGEGTTVTVFLPRGSPSEPPHTRAARTSKPGTDPPRSTRLSG